MQGPKQCLEQTLSSAKEGLDTPLMSVYETTSSTFCSLQTTACFTVIHLHRRASAQIDTRQNQQMTVCPLKRHSSDTSQAQPGPGSPGFSKLHPALTTGLLYSQCHSVALLTSGLSEHNTHELTLAHRSKIIEIPKG